MIGCAARRRHRVVIDAVAPARHATSTLDALRPPRADVTALALRSVAGCPVRGQPLVIAAREAEEGRGALASVATNMSQSEAQREEHQRRKRPHEQWLGGLAMEGAWLRQLRGETGSWAATTSGLAS